MVVPSAVQFTVGFGGTAVVSRYEVAVERALEDAAEFSKDVLDRELFERGTEVALRLVFRNGTKHAGPACRK